MSSDSHKGTTPEHPSSSETRGGGRRFGRGGRHAGRGGRGRGHRPKKNAAAVSSPTEHVTHEPSPAVAAADAPVERSGDDKGRGKHTNHHRSKGNHPKGGRGGRNPARGRGKGRGRAGRGGSSGRHGPEKHGKGGPDKHTDDDSSSAPPSQPPEHSNAEHDENKRLGQQAKDTSERALDASPVEAETIKEETTNQRTNGVNDTRPTTATPQDEAAPVETPRPVLTLPTPPPTRSGKLMILSRNQKLPPAATNSTDEQKVTEGVASIALQDGDETGKDKAKKKKKSKKKKEKKEKPEEEPVQPATPEEEVTTTEALQKLPAQEVSITASTSVKIRRSESTASFKSDQTPPNKIVPMMMLSKTGAIKTGKKKKKKKLSSDDRANQEAAQLFNSSVQRCIAHSDPDSLREILQDRRNHNFALDSVVLESVMKAYVMAAMFEDAVYCLRHCTLPGTLSTVQTERILQCLPQNLRNSSAYTAADMINVLCIATAFDTPMTRTYFLRIVRGIALEFLEEATSARDRICSSSCERLVRGGLCVVDARLERGKKPTDLLVVPGNQLGVFVPDTMENRGIQAGDAVSILPYAGPYPLSAESLDRSMIEATVTNTNPMVLRLQDKGNLNLLASLTEDETGNVYRIDKLANRMGFNRQLAAAVAMCSPLNPGGERDPRRPSPQLIRAITAMDENIDRVMGNAANGAAKPVQYRADGTPELTSTAALCNEGVSWVFKDEKRTEYDDEENQDSIRMTARLLLEQHNALEYLNESQQLAVEGAVTNRLTLVQGPPGTGKVSLSRTGGIMVYTPYSNAMCNILQTAVAIRILSHWARLANGESPILATSDSNIAVDNLVEGCAAAGLRVVRLGRPEAIRPELLRYCVDRPPSSYSSGNLNNSGHGDRGRDIASAHKERVKQLKNAQVICCTCIGSGGDILDSMTFERVLVDEATQATEPAVLVPLMRGCRQLVLVGDHCQLPPTVLSTRAEEEGHGVPLFSRMVACGVPPFMLDTQYRMHPRIAMFPSDLFYGGMLKNGVSAPERRPLQGFPWPVEEFPVAFFPVKGIEMDDGVSKYNEAEAEVACNAVGMLLAGGQCTVSDIAVVTPYAAQAKLIRRMTRRLQEKSGPPYVEVSSVDGFQGREKEAVVFSSVRSNDYGAIGFTKDWRRVNVSFTRARRALIVIGNDTTLRRGDPETWGPWLAWVDAHGLNMDKPGIARGRYDAEQLRRVRGGTTAAEMLKDVLARQQTQLKIAERQQERAEKHTEGHIQAKSAVEATQNEVTRSLEEDLAEMENADGHWDDTDDDDDEVELKHSVSRATLTSATSSNDIRAADESSDPVDVWDL